MNYRHGETAANAPADLASGEDGPADRAKILMKIGSRPVGLHSSFMEVADRRRAGWDKPGAPLPRSQAQLTFAP